MASAVIPRKYNCGNCYPLLSKAITFFCDVLFEPCNHASVKTLLRRRRPVVDQLQQVTKTCQLNLVAKDVGDLLAPVIPCAHVGP